MEIIYSSNSMGDTELIQDEQRFILSMETLIGFNTVADLVSYYKGEYVKLSGFIKANKELQALADLDDGVIKYISAGFDIYTMGERYWLSINDKLEGSLNCVMRKFKYMVAELSTEVEWTIGENADGSN